MDKTEKNNKYSKLSLVFTIVAGIFILVHYYLYKLNSFTLILISLVVVFHIVFFHVGLGLWSKHKFLFHKGGSDEK